MMKIRQLFLHRLGKRIPVLASLQVYCPEQRLSAEPASLLPLPREEPPVELLPFGCQLWVMFSWQQGGCLQLGAGVEAAWQGLGPGVDFQT